MKIVHFSELSRTWTFLPFTSGALRSLRTFLISFSTFSPSFLFTRRMAAPFRPGSIVVLTTSPTPLKIPAASASVASSGRSSLDPLGSLARSLVLGFRGFDLSRHTTRPRHRTPWYEVP